MILRFRKTPPVQVQISRLKACRLGSGVPRPRGKSLPNTPQLPEPSPTTWSFIMQNPTAGIEDSEYGAGLAEDLYAAWFVFQGFTDGADDRDPWERDADWWKQ